MSSFARNQLEKYGWKTGQGLGKNEQGILDAIRPALKFNTNGLGFDVGKEYKNNWWENAYNQSAKSLKISNSKEGVEIQSDDPIESDRRKKVSKRSYDGSFIKSGNIVEDEESRVPEIPTFSNLEETVWKKCGRTAHKGARHGLYLTGKLQRLKQQDDTLLKNMQNKYKSCTLEHNCKIESCINEVVTPNLQSEDMCNMPEINNGHKTKKHKEKCKKKHSILE